MCPLKHFRRTSFIQEQYLAIKGRRRNSLSCHNQKKEKKKRIEHFESLTKVFNKAKKNDLKKVTFSGCYQIMRQNLRQYKVQ